MFGSNRKRGAEFPPIPGGQPTNKKRKGATKVVTNAATKGRVVAKKKLDTPNVAYQALAAKKKSAAARRHTGEQKVSTNKTTQKFLDAQASELLLISVKIAKQRAVIKSHNETIASLEVKAEYWRKLGEEVAKKYDRDIAKAFQAGQAAGFKQVFARVNKHMDHMKKTLKKDIGDYDKKIKKPMAQRDSD